MSKRLAITVTDQEALMQIGRLAAEFIAQPETWPVFFAWLGSSKWPVPTEASEGMRRDVLETLAALPPMPDRAQMACTHKVGPRR